MASIKNGAKGPEVTLLQGVLKHMGYDLEIDGHFGDGTEDAVKKAQTDLGIGVDGKVGPQTAAAFIGKIGRDKAQASLDLASAKAQAGKKA